MNEEQWKMGRGLPPEQLAQADFKSDCICTQQSHSLLETMRHVEQTFGRPLHAVSCHGMDVKLESQPKGRRLTIRPFPASNRVNDLL